MKRKLAGTVLVTILLVLINAPAFALEIMSDSTMKKITGQAGVSITVDDVVLEAWIESLKFTDSDGVSDSGTPGEPASIVLPDLHLTNDFQAITSVSGGALASPGTGLKQTGMAGVQKMAGGTFRFHPLSIDVGRCPVLSAAMTYNQGGQATINGLVIGLPTLEANIPDITLPIRIEQAGAANDGAEFFRLQFNDVTLHILGGRMEIAPH